MNAQTTNFQSVPFVSFPHLKLYYLFDISLIHRKFNIDRNILQNISISCDVRQTYADCSSWKIRFENHSKVFYRRCIEMTAKINFSMQNELNQIKMKLFSSPNCQRLNEKNSLVLDVFEAVRPHVNLSFDNILAHINTIYVLKTKTGALAAQGYLRLKVLYKSYELSFHFSRKNKKCSTKMFNYCTFFQFSNFPIFQFQISSNIQNVCYLLTGSNVIYS